MVLPKLLENILATVTEDNTLSSWSMFQGADGAINFKLRFVGSHCNSQEPANNIKQVRYRRITDKQAHRDFNRSQTWKNKAQDQQTMQTTTQPNVGQCPSSTPLVIDQPAQTSSSVKRESRVGVTTKAKASEEVELARSDSDLSETLNPNAESFIMPTHAPEDESADLEMDASLSPELSREYRQAPSAHTSTPLESSVQQLTLDSDEDAVISMEGATSDEVTPHYSTINNQASTRSEAANPMETTPAWARIMLEHLEKTMDRGLDIVKTIDRGDTLSDNG